MVNVILYNVASYTGWEGLSLFWVIAPLSSYIRLPMEKMTSTKKTKLERVGMITPPRLHTVPLEASRA